MNIQRRSNVWFVSPWFFSLSVALILTFCSAATARLHAAERKVAEQKVIAQGLASPESAAVGPDGRLYVTSIGKSGVDGDGTVVGIENGKPTAFAKGLDDPKGLVVYKNDLYVADKTRVWRIDPTGAATVYADADAFPTRPKFLNDIEASPQGTSSFPIAERLPRTAPCSASSHRSRSTPS